MSTSSSATLTCEQFTFLDNVCRSICNKPKIRFCGIINSMGRLVAGSFKDSILPLDNDQQRQMLYMQSRLELSMKGEFDDSLGCVNHVVTYRDNVVIVNVPSKNQQYHVLISAERIADVRHIVDCVSDILGECDIFSNRYMPKYIDGKKEFAKKKTT